MQELCFTQAITVQVRQAQEVHNQFTQSYPEFRSSHGCLSSPGLFLTYIEMDMDTTHMGALVKSAYKRYGAVPFEGVVQLKLFPKTKIKSFE